MEIASINSQAVQWADVSQKMPIHGSQGKNVSKEDAKIAESCKQFEAILWRQMLEKSLKPMLHTSDGDGDKTETYNYFLTNAISESVSGSSNGISHLLQEQLVNKHQTSQKI